MAKLGNSDEEVGLLQQVTDRSNYFCMNHLNRKSLKHIEAKVAIDCLMLSGSREWEVKLTIGGQDGGCSGDNLLTLRMSRRLARVQSFRFRRRSCCWSCWARVSVKLFGGGRLGSWRRLQSDLGRGAGTIPKNFLYLLDHLTTRTMFWNSRVRSRHWFFFTSC